MNKHFPTKKSKINSNNRPPALILTLLGFVFVFATIGLINDVSTWKGIRPFGALSDVFAQVGGFALNTKKISKQLDGGGNLLESNDRCQVIDPNKAEIKTASQLSRFALPSLEGNMGGANTSIVLDYGYDEELNTKILNYASDLNMSYNVGLVTVNHPASVLATVKFIKETNAAGMMPIIRLCVAGVCSFKDQNQIVEFYNLVHGITASDDYFIGVVGPNEPGSGEPEIEMKGFVDGLDYGALIDETNQVAKALQGLRPSGVNAGHMLIAPAIFNLTNSVNNDVKEYLYSGRLDPDLYDYYLGNTYELSNGVSAYDFYSLGAETNGENSLKDYADGKDIPVIVSEFGAFFENYPGRRSVALEEQKQSFAKFCQDGNVEGVLFFRSFLNENGSVALNEELVWKDRHGMTPSEHSEIIGDCPIQKKAGFKDFSWANCNFDSCLYPKEYSTNSTATACGTETENRTFNLENGAALKVVQDGDMYITRKIGTVEVSMPIKQFGSNSSAGTSSLPYTPICAEVAAYYANSEVDALNQFAGVLTTNSSTIVNTVDNSYTGKAPLSDSIVVMSDSQGAPTPERGTFLPSEWFSNVNRQSALPGSGAIGFSDGTYTIPSVTQNDIVVLWLGTNDCQTLDLNQYKSNINSIISKLDAKEIILIPTPLRTDEQLCSDEKIISFNNFLKSLDNSNSIRYLNVNYDASNKKSFLESDGLHIGNYKPINEGLYSLISTGAASTVNFSSGTLTNSSYTNAYTMPWLGSAINCSAELILASNEFARLTDKANLNPGSSSLETFKELNSSQNPFGTEYWEEYFSQNGGNSIYPVPWNNANKTIQDEKALCIDSLGYCLDKGVASDTINGLRDYLPQNTPSRYKKTSCSSEAIYLENQSNYIIGPEVVVEPASEVWRGTGSEVCRKYANRKNTDKDVLAGVDYPSQLGGVLSEQYQAAALDCKIENKSIVANGSSFYCPDMVYYESFNYCSNDLIQKGACAIPAEYANCLKYNPEGGDEIYIKTDKWPDAPNYSIPGVYDSLYRMYQRLQTQMSERGLKMVFRENLGWKVEVTSKVRDASRPLAESNDRGLPDVIPYRYSQDLDSCEVPTNIFDNGTLLAKTNPTKTEYQYYDWLGYLDILQELSSAYTKDSTFSAEKLIDNPNYGKNNAANNTRRKVLETGLASITTSFPVLTCDQVEQWKFDENPVQSTSTDSSNQPSTQYYCPVEAGLCAKGPDVESHEGLKAIDLFSANYKDGEQNVIAPFDGKIVTAQKGNEFSYCDNGTKSGGRIYFEGKIDGKTVKLMFLHVLVDDSVKVGNEYKAGQRITRVSKLSDDDITSVNEGGCIGKDGPHLHMEIEEGQYKNNIVDFTKALGCNMQGATGLGYGDFDNYGDTCNARSNITLGVQGEVGASTSANLVLNPDAQIKPDDKLTCITDTSDKRFDDELGEFLCSKGYAIEGLCDNSCKVPPEEQISGDVKKLDFGETTCPIQNDACYQGPLGGFTHYCSTTSDPRPSLSYDLYTKGAARGNSDLYAPEAGQIVQIIASQNNFCPNLGTKPETIREQLKKVNSERSNGAALVEIINNMSDEELLSMRSNGGYIIYQGRSGVKYIFLHLGITSSIMSDYVTTYDKPGKFMTINGNTIRLYEIPSDLWTPCIQGTHLHTNASYNGEKINPYVLYGDVLGCGSTSSCVYDKACEAPQWTTVTNDENTVSQNSTTSSALNAACKYDENGNPIVDGDKNFSSIQCLLDEVADLIGRDYPGITGNVIRAILDVESRGETDKRPGDPTYVSYTTDNGYGTKGPMQFTQIGWDGIMRTDADLILYCVKGLGLPFNTVEDLSHDDAVILGVALCAGGAKLARDGRGYLGIPKGQEFTEQQWTQRVYDATGPDGFYDVTVEQLDELLNQYPGTESIIKLREKIANPNYKISALHIASAPYYGRHPTYGDCIWQYGGEVGDYCQLVFREYSRIVNDTNDDGVSDGTPDPKYVCSTN